MVLCLVSGLALPVLGGHPQVARTFLGTLGGGLRQLRGVFGSGSATSAASRRLTRDRCRPAPAIVASTLGPVYFGMFSPAAG
jgi:hypothetical protein